MRICALSKKLITFRRAGMLRYAIHQSRARILYLTRVRLPSANRIESNRIESRQAAATAACVSTLFAAGAAADAAFLPLAETTGAGGCVLYTGPHTTAFAC